MNVYRKKMVHSIVSMIVVNLTMERIKKYVKFKVDIVMILTRLKTMDVPNVRLIKIGLWRMLLYFIKINQMSYKDLECLS